MLIRGYDLSKQIAESTRDYHRMHAYSAALTALRGQIDHITEHQQAITIDYIKEYFGPFIVQAASGLVPTALEELQEELEAILSAELDDSGI